MAFLRTAPYVFKTLFYSIFLSHIHCLIIAFAVCITYTSCENLEHVTYINSNIVTIAHVKMSKKNWQFKIGDKCCSITFFSVFFYYVAHSFSIFYSL